MKLHKAFAVSDGGWRGWSANQVSELAAEQVALRYCRGFAAKNPQDRCWVVMVDEETRYLVSAVMPDRANRMASYRRCSRPVRLFGRSGRCESIRHPALRGVSLLCRGDAKTEVRRTFAAGCPKCIRAGEGACGPNILPHEHGEKVAVHVQDRGDFR